MLDGADVRSLSLNRLRNKFGFVGQESILFDTTIAENIGLGKDEATLEEIKQAAKDANIHEFVSTSLPDGYDTNVGKHYIYIHTYVRRFDLMAIIRVSCRILMLGMGGGGVEIQWTRG